MRTALSKIVAHCSCNSVRERSFRISHRVGAEAFQEGYVATKQFQGGASKNLHRTSYI